MKRLIILNFIVLLIIASSAPAATRLVPGEYPTIQAAIDDCNNGDVVAVADGIYTGDGNRDIDFLGKAITVKSINGPDDCIIDCNGTESDPHRGFYFHSGEDAKSVVEGFTITNAGAETFYGGAIYCRQSSPTINKCTINASIAAAGGGIYCYESNPTIGNCTITGNTGGHRGSGGISCGASNPTISNCIINGNVASIGGGIFCRDASNPLIINCTISGNTTSGNGGGIYCLDTSSPTIANCILWGNMASESNQIAVGHPYYSGENVLTVNYSNVQGGQDDVYIKPGCVLNWGEGNIDADPLFVDANNGDYRLRNSSPCINAGTNNPQGCLSETDLDGGPRIVNRIVDMGAYEFGHIWYVDMVNGDDNNDGLSPEMAFATIQKGIDLAMDGEIVSVFPGVYNETIDFLGKAIMVQSAEDVAVLQTQDYFAVLFCNGEGPDSILRNFVIRNSFMAIYIDGSSPTISNVTIVDNGFGIAAYTGSQPNISNSIFWNNIFGDLFGCQATYSCVQNGCLGPGNLDIDPRFADPEGGDYHLQSKTGRYWPQYDVWILDEAFSPCIDGGDPNAAYHSEPMPNGGRVNMGAYGGTAYASKKEMRWLHSDTNKDGWVNMMDFAMIALDWLRYEPGTSNLPPEVSIIKPHEGDIFPPWESERGIIEIEADAWDSDGSVVWMEFLANGDVIGEDNNGADGWKTEWQDPAGGNYSLTAEATDDDGESTTSSAVEIRVGGAPR